MHFLGRDSNMSEQDTDKDEKTPTVSRRRALAKLGLAVGVAYVAPSVLRINRNVQAFNFLTPCPPPDNVPSGPASCPP